MTTANNQRHQFYNKCTRSKITNVKDAYKDHGEIKRFKEANEKFGD